MAAESSVWLLQGVVCKRAACGWFRNAFGAFRKLYPVRTATIHFHGESRPQTTIPEPEGNRIRGRPQRALTTVLQPAEIELDPEAKFAKKPAKMVHVRGYELRVATPHE